MGKRSCFQDPTVELMDMKPNTVLNDLPDDLCLVPSASVRKAWHLSGTTEWRMERSGELQPIRIGRRKFYRLSDLRRFLDQAAKKPPFAVPWR